MHTFIAILLFANAILHCIQAFLYGFNKQTIPVFIWGIVLAVFGYYWLGTPPNGIKWASLIMPLVGGIGLSTQLSKSTNAKWIDYGIIGLDVVTVGLIAYLMFG